MIRKNQETKIETKEKVKKMIDTKTGMYISEERVLSVWEVYDNARQASYELYVKRCQAQDEYDNTDWTVIDLAETIEDNQDKYTRALTSQRQYISNALDTIEENLNEQENLSEYTTDEIDAMDIVTRVSEIAYFTGKKAEYSKNLNTAILAENDELVTYYHRLRLISSVTLAALKRSYSIYN